MEAKDVATAFGILVTLAGGVRWILGFYFRKVNEIEHLKNEERKRTVDGLARRLEGNNSAMTMFQKELDGFRLVLQEHNLQMKDFDRVVQLIQKQWEKTAEQLEKRYQALENAEIIHAGGNTYVLKTKRPY